MSSDMGRPDVAFETGQKTTAPPHVTRDAWAASSRQAQFTVSVGCPDAPCDMGQDR